MGQLATGLLSLSGWAALAALFTLPALEAPAFLGLVLPGELALLLGGVMASQDRIPLAGALAGDTAGYWIGRHWGPRLLTSGLGRRLAWMGAGCPRVAISPVIPRSVSTCRQGWSS